MHFTMKKLILSLAVIALAVIGVRGADLRELTFQVAMPAKEAPKLDGVLSAFPHP